MALAKKNSFITSITGKFGGNVFRHDNSGQHVYAYPRIVKKQPTDDQRDQRTWYKELKSVEAKNGVPKDETMEEPDLPAYAIYRPSEFFFYRQRSIFQPAMETVVVDDASLFQIELWVDTHEFLWHQIPNSTRDFVITFMCKWWWQAYKLSGGTPELGLWNAIQKITFAAEYCASGTVASLVPIMSLFAVLALVAAVAVFYSRDYVRHVFPEMAVLLWNETGVYWGRMIHRQSNQMFDFLLGPPVSPQGCIHGLMPDSAFRYGNDWVYWELIEGFKERSFYWETNQWERLRNYFISDGYLIKPAIVRSCLKNLWPPFTYVQNGYTYDGTTPFAYIDDIYDETPW